MSPKTLVDSDVLSAVMRRDAKALERSRQYLTEHPQLSLSIITRFEILRGLKAKLRLASKDLIDFARPAKYFQFQMRSLSAHRTSTLSCTNRAG
jgi:predicted nucleic acid-binding protein